MSDEIRNRKEGMQYRRFGRTGRELSVITLGGMRYRAAGGKPREDAPDEAVEHCARITEMALDAGINHIETAYGYGKSEHVYGKALNEVLKVPRDRYHFMTKGSADSAEGMRRMVDEQLAGLRMDHIDLYGWHGINNPELLATACAKGGPVEELHRLRDEGVVGAVGFSTHGPLEVIVDALATGLFDFVNLHYYYFFQRNQGAVDYAAAKDIGVFIISPNDKGGQLFHAPPLLRELTAPLTPIQWNARWCLRTPRVQTLSFGMTEPEHLEAMRGIFPVEVPMSERDRHVEQAMNERLLADPWAAWDGYEMTGDPSGINVPEVLRFRRMLRCYDMETFGLYRYNMFSEKGHWFPGAFATDEALAELDASKAPPQVSVGELLRETHRALHRPKEGEGEGCRQ